MDRKVYNEIITHIREFKGLSIECFASLKNNFPNIKESALCSILSTEFQRQMKCNYNKSETEMNKYYNWYMDIMANEEPPGQILKLSKEINISPCLIAKLILTKICENTESYDGSSSVHNNVNKLLRDPSLIKNKYLAYDMYLCTLYDDQYSPIVETMKSSLGQQFEIKLYRQINDLGIAYRDENYLRKLGYDKTPDVKLEIPIAIDGFIIHWIESKAIFADLEVHKEYLKNQYSSYWNRFGTGLVIYWFGFLENVNSPFEKRFIIRDHLPNTITILE